MCDSGGIAAAGGGAQPRNEMNLPSPEPPTPMPITPQPPGGF